MIEETIDTMIEKYRKPHRIFIFNIDGEIRSICYPNYRRKQELIFNRMQELREQKMGTKERDR